jgi:hypothetical protein
MNPDTENVGALVNEALGEARELIKLEVALAKDEVVREVTKARSAAIALAIAAVALNVAIAMALFAVAVASNATVPVAVGIASALFVTAGIAGARGLRGWPTVFLSRTRRRLEEDVRELKENAHGA